MDKEPVQMDKKEWNKWTKAIKEWKIGSIMEKRVTKCEKGTGKQWERRRKKIGNIVNNANTHQHLWSQIEKDKCRERLLG